jgi:hypothetical protein
MDPVCPRAPWAERETDGTESVGIPDLVTVLASRQSPGCGSETADLCLHPCTSVLARSYSLIESAKLCGVEAKAYLLHTMRAAVNKPRRHTAARVLASRSSTIDTGGRSPEQAPSRVPHSLSDRNLLDTSVVRAVARRANATRHAGG